MKNMMTTTLRDTSLMIYQLVVKHYLIGYNTHKTHRGDFIMNNKLTDVVYFKRIKTFITKHKQGFIFIMGILLILLAYPLATMLSTQIIIHDANSYQTTYDPQKAFFLIFSFFLSGSLICIFSMKQK